jgi:hypothetical protein
MRTAASANDLAGTHEHHTAATTTTTAAFRAARGRSLSATTTRTAGQHRERSAASEMTI